MSITVLVVDDQPLMRAALRTALHAVREDISILPASSLEDAGRQIRASTPPDLTVLDLHLPDACGTATLDAFRRHHPSLRIVALAERADPAIVQACRKAGNVSLITKMACMDAVIDCLRNTLAGQICIDGKLRHGTVSLPPAAAVEQPVQGRWLGSPNGARHEGSVQKVSEPLPGAALPRDMREYHDGRHLGLTERQRCVLKLMMMGLPNKAICRELHLAEGTVKVHVSAVLRALGVSCRAQVAMAALRSGIVMDEIVIR